MAWTRIDMKQMYCITKQHWNGSRLSRKTTSCLEFRINHKMKRPAQSYLQRNKQRIFWKFISHIWVLALKSLEAQMTLPKIGHSTSCSWRFLTCVDWTWTLKIDLDKFLQSISQMLHQFSWHPNMIPSDLVCASNYQSRDASCLLSESCFEKWSMSQNER